QHRDERAAARHRCGVRRDAPAQGRRRRRAPLRPGARCGRGRTAVRSAGLVGRGGPAGFAGPLPPGTVVRLPRRGTSDGRRRWTGERTGGAGRRVPASPVGSPLSTGRSSSCAPVTRPAPTQPPVREALSPSGQPTAPHWRPARNVLPGVIHVSEIKLVAEARTEFGKGAARRIRRADKIPAVLYGHGSDPLHVTLPGHDTMMALKHSNALFSIELEGKAQLAITKDVQRDPVRNVIEHVDLLIVKKGEKVAVDVPVVVTGESAPGT